MARKTPLIPTGELFDPHKAVEGPIRGLRHNIPRMDVPDSPRHYGESSPGSRFGKRSSRRQGGRARAAEPPRETSRGGGGVTDPRTRGAPAQKSAPAPIGDKAREEADYWKRQGYELPTDENGAPVMPSDPRHAEYIDGLGNLRPGVKKWGGQDLIADVKFYDQTFAGVDNPSDYREEQQYWYGNFSEARTKRGQFDSLDEYDEWFRGIAGASYEIGPFMKEIYENALPDNLRGEYEGLKEQRKLDALIEKNRQKLEDNRDFYGDDYAVNPITGNIEPSPAAIEKKSQEADQKQADQEQAKLDAEDEKKRYEAQKQDYTRAKNYGRTMDTISGMLNEDDTLAIYGTDDIDATATSSTEQAQVIEDRLREEKLMLVDQNEDGLDGASPDFALVKDDAANRGKYTPITGHELAEHVMSADARERRAEEYNTKYGEKQTPVVADFTVTRQKNGKDQHLFMDRATVEQLQKEAKQDYGPLTFKDHAQGTTVTMVFKDGKYVKEEEAG